MRIHLVPNCVCVCVCVNNLSIWSICFLNCDSPFTRCIYFAKIVVTYFRYILQISFPLCCLIIVSMISLMKEIFLILMMSDEAIWIFSMYNSIVYFLIVLLKEQLLSLILLK